MSNKIFMLKKITPLYNFIYLPTPMNISYWWNFGSLLGMCLIIQIISGFFLSLHYCPNIFLAFVSIQHIMLDINYGWLFRMTHMNGASFFFICIYLHIGRGIYYNSYKFTKTWMIGIIIMLLTMATAFLGYVLPWGQMSYWGAMVITNLISAIPYIGQSITEWIWGGFSINNATLNRFYSFHFILPLIISLMVMIHLTFLHSTGSSNPLGYNSNLYKINFYPFFLIKDFITFIIMIFLLMFINFQMPYLLSEPDNFINANPLVTPAHIKPEWYFLFAYAILRSIPNKLGGVIALFMSILILMILPLYSPLMISWKFYPLNQLFFWLFSLSFIMLTWSGGQPIEYPYIQISQTFSLIYFIFFLSSNELMKLYDLMLFSK